MHCCAFGCVDAVGNSNAAGSGWSGSVARGGRLPQLRAVIGRRRCSSSVASLREMNLGILYRCITRPSLNLFPSCARRPSTAHLSVSHLSI